MRTVSVAGRVAAIAAVVAAVVIVAILLFGGGGAYSVKADFENAGQLVNGNQVTIGGTPAGAIDNIQITSNGQAEVTMSIDDKYQPLPAGTQAVIRQASQSGIANRYVELELPPGNRKTGEEKSIPDGGTIPITHTTTTVDLDQLFNTLDPDTRASLKAFFKNSAAQFKGKTAQQRAAYHFLNPALSTSSRLFGELNRDSPLLSRFLVDSSTLVTALAERRDSLAAFVGNANATFRALGNQRIALEQAISFLPDFMRQANTTFVNLRGALNDLDPLVNASKPVAIRLRPFLAQLRPLAHDAVPTIRDLSDVVLKPGPNNDLFNLEESFPLLAQTALDTKVRSPNFGTGPVNVGSVRGAFPETNQALIDSAPIIGQGRPYTPDLMGWFDDFSTTGPTDAGGGVGRAQINFNVVNISGAIPGVPLGGIIPLAGAIDRGTTIAQLARTGQFHRCPGASEEQAADGSNVFTPAQQTALDCKESGRAVGPNPAHP